MVVLSLLLALRIRRLNPQPTISAKKIRWVDFLQQQDRRRTLQLRHHSSTILLFFLEKYVIGCLDARA